MFSRVRIARVVYFAEIIQFHSLSKSTWTGITKEIMGKRRRPNKGPKKSSGGGKAGGGYSNLTMENAAFENYYQKQGIVPEGEWDQFMGMLKTNLPTAFRITGFRGQASQVLNYMKGECFNDLLQSNSEEAIEARPEPIQWYPNNLAWQLKLSRKNIRKMPSLEKLHLFLIAETESGNISRQEIVSMIPPLLLQVKPQHRVLDMCAAPGSKTAQLIEMIHAEQTLGWPEGFVIGNDDDNRRCYIMVHQAKRLNSPCCMVVNHDASVFPRLRVPGPDGQMKFIEYDRILCDVPCGGDGTMRKNYAIWKKWTPLSGFNLHPLQRRILLRGIELLAVGGRLVYSTCSFNPIENEAVIASILKQSEGAVRLVDVSGEMTGLKRQPGMTSWKVIDEKGQVFSSMEDVAEREPKDKIRRFKPSFWPPTEEEAKDMNLHRCVRILPHHQDTGGFFVAVLEKTGPLPWMKQGTSSTSQAESVSSEEMSSGEVIEGDASNLDAAAETSTEPAASEQTTEPAASEQTSQTDEPAGPPAKKPRFSNYKEDPFVFFKGDEEIWPSMKEFYKVDDAFPLTQLLTRCHVGKKRNLYLTNRIIKDILQNNEDRLKVINSGVRVWARSDAPDVPCNFRLAQEGINVLYPYLNERKLTITRQDVITLFSEESPFTKNFSEEIRETLENMSMGTLILTYYPSTDGQEETDSPIILVAWRGKTSLRSYVAKGDRQHILRMVGGPVEEKKKPRNQRGSGNSQTEQSGEGLGDEGEEEEEGDGLLATEEEGDGCLATEAGDDCQAEEEENGDASLAMEEGDGCLATKTGNGDLTTEKGVLVAEGNANCDSLEEGGGEK